MLPFVGIVDPHQAKAACSKSRATLPQESTVVRCALLLIALSLPLNPAFTQDKFYPFSIDQDALKGAPDFSFLNHPLGPADQIVVSGGHFSRLGAVAASKRRLTRQIAVRVKNGGRRQKAGLEPVAPPSDSDRVRFFGVNLAFGANFPADGDAARIARRLRRLGVNLVRLHHMDSQPDSNPSNAGSLLTTGPYPTLNPTAVARLRAFLDALKAEGIYADLNLHVGYTFRPAVDQVPSLPDGLRFPTQSKPLHIFYPRMVSLQAEFAQKVIEALALRDDPVLAMVEVDNETSLLQAWQTGGLDGYLLGEYKTEFQGQWNAFLKSKYGSTDALRTAWGDGDPPGPELLSADPQQWRIEIHQPAQARFDVLAEDPATVRVEVARGGAPVIMKQVGFSTDTERAYAAEVEMRADLPDGVSRSVYWDVKQDVSPWRTLKGGAISVTNSWQKFTMAVPATLAMNAVGRFGLSVENLEVPGYIRNWSFRQGARRGLADGETLEDASVSLVPEGEVSTTARIDDYLLFLTDGDRQYTNQISRAVCSAAGPLVAITGTQMGYGGLLNLDSQAALDFQDNHFYVDHYNFPHTAWDSRDWRIRDASSLGSGLSAFVNIAAAREAGRPYTVSEFNQPWPNTQGAEIDVTLAAFAAFQDWDSIMHFAYSHGRNWDDGVPNGFNINGDWTKFPNIGQAAWLFRSGAIQPGREPVELVVSQALRLQAGREKRNGNISSFLTDRLGYDPATPFAHPVAVRREQDAQPTKAISQTPAASPYQSDTGELSYDRDQKLFLIHAPMVAGVIGFLGQRKISAGAIDVELAPSSSEFAAILVTALDQQPLGNSARLLLSTPGYALRSRLASDPPSPEALVNYPSTVDWWTVEPDPNFPSKRSGNLSGGIRPVWIKRVESYLTLRTQAIKLTVYPLDGTGMRLTALSDTDVLPVEGGFRVHLQAAGQSPSPWYELVAEYGGFRPWAFLPRLPADLDFPWPGH